VLRFGFDEVNQSSSAVPNPLFSDPLHFRVESKKQLSVASYCGFYYFIAVDNKEGADAISRVFPHLPIFYVPYGGGNYN